MNGGDDDNGNEGDGGDGGDDDNGNEGDGDGDGGDDDDNGGGDDDNGRAAAGEAKLLLDGQELATAAPEHLRMMGLLLDQHLNI